MSLTAGVIRPCLIMEYVKSQNMRLPSITFVAVGCIILLLASGNQISAASLTITQTISLQGQISPSPPSEVVFWKADFETGTYYDFTDAGYNWGGETQEEPPYSALTIITNPVFKGQYACKAEVITPPPSDYVSTPSGQIGLIHAKALRWHPIDTLTEAYYGAALYLSPGFSTIEGGANSWVNVIQVHGLGDSLALPAYLIISKTTSHVLKFNVETKDQIGTTTRFWQGDAIVGQWFTIVFHLKFTTEANGGILECWINGNKIASRTGDYTVGGAYASGFFDAGIYQSYLSPAQYVLIDEMIVASTLEAATPLRS